MPSYDAQWFHNLVCEKLTGLLDGSLGKKKLMIFIPPQHGKSEISSRRFPAFAFGKYPDLKVALCSYSGTIASGFNRDIQKIMSEESYYELFPNSAFTEKNVLSKSSNELVRNTNQFEIIGGTGFLKSVGLGGGLTSVTVDLGIIDDPYKDRKEASSIVVRDTAWEWYENVFLTRLHNESKQLLLFTRWHEDDLAGRILARESDEWEVIAIPALKEEFPPLPEAIEINDPRQVDDALWENRHSKFTINKIREHSPVTFNSLYQQRPSALEGNMIKRDWFDVLDYIDYDKYKVDVWIDGAYTENVKNDPTALMITNYRENEVVIEHSYTLRLEMFELLDRIDTIFDAHDLDRSTTRVWIEPKASGKSIRSMLNKKGYNAIEIPNRRAQMGKIERTETSSPTLHSGKFKLLKGAWNESFLSEVTTFPNGVHDDQLDNLTYSCLEYFVNNNNTMSDHYNNITID